MDYKNIKNFDELIDFEHGTLGTESRIFEQGLNKKIGLIFL